MKFEEMGIADGKTLVLLPGTACTWQINFAMVIDDLKERYHLICVNYDGFDGDNSRPFTDMLTVTGKIEDYILEHHNGKVGEGCGYRFDVMGRIHPVVGSNCRGCMLFSDQFNVP